MKAPCFYRRALQATRINTRSLEKNGNRTQLLNFPRLERCRRWEDTPPQAVWVKKVVTVVSKAGASFDRNRITMFAWRMRSFPESLSLLSQLLMTVVSGLEINTEHWWNTPPREISLALRASDSTVRLYGLHIALLVSRRNSSRISSREDTQEIGDLLREQPMVFAFVLNSTYISTACRQRVLMPHPHG